MRELLALLVICLGVWIIRSPADAGNTFRTFYVCVTAETPCGY